MNGREAYGEQITRNRAAETVASDIVQLAADGSSLRVRLRGCFITECRLTDPAAGVLRDVLYAEEEHTVPKLMATHVMAPAGPYEGPGGQHGFARWADYSVERIGADTLQLQTTRTDGPVVLTKRFQLTSSSLRSETTLINPDAETLRTSIGEHYYFPLPGASTDGLTINGQPIDALLGEGTLEQIMSGEAAFWSGFPGSAEIRFPAGYTMQLSASIDSDAPLGMLLWHKPASETICFEPTAGYRHAVMNSCLCLEQNESATLSSTLTLI